MEKHGGLRRWSQGRRRAGRGRLTEWNEKGMEGGGGGGEDKVEEELEEED